jgi:TRAP-type C4-dicarboxylate transport system permease small subunit
MRRFLDWLYRAGGMVAVVLLVALVLVVLAQICGRLIGVVVPGAIQAAGYLMAATIFLALAYTQAAAEHIRVSLVIEHVGPRLHWCLEIWCLACGACLAGYYGFYSAQLAWESWLFDDRSDGLLAIPTCIPQAAMALGIVLFCVRLVDELFQLVRTGTPLGDGSGGASGHGRVPDGFESGEHGAPRGTGE